jgi:hypothetical protein
MQLPAPSASCARRADLSASVTSRPDVLIYSEQSRRGLGATDGFAFVPHTVAVLSKRHLLGVGRDRSQSDPRIIFDEFGRL